MQDIESILLEPVGCLAEFPPEPFHEIAVQLFGRKGKASNSASRSYWHLLNLMEAAGGSLDEAARCSMEQLEAEAVTSAKMYEDVSPALAELRAMGVRLYVTSSLSRAAVDRFTTQNALAGYLAGSYARDNTAGVKAAPLLRAIVEASLRPERTMFLTDTAEGLKVARSAGVQPVLMMNDPDESLRLAMHNPAGGVVSLHELPDFIRLVAAQNQNGLGIRPE